MDNNDILRRLRYTLDYNDSKMIDLFASVSQVVNRSELNEWLKKEDDPDFRELDDRMLAVFLNGLIIEKRGKREGPPPILENELNNNMILRKLKIAFDLKTDDILAMFASIDKKISAHELSAFLRNPSKSKYRHCNDQYLRNFLTSIQNKYRV